MLNRIRDLLGDSLLYGASKFLSQLISFFLIPIYTLYLTPGDFGIITILSIFSVCLTLFLNFGIDSSVYNVLGLTREQSEDAKTNITDTGAIMVCVLSSLFLIILLISSESIAGALLNSGQLQFAVVLSLLTSYLDTWATIPLVELRIKRRVKVVSASNIINVIASIFFSIVLIVFLDYGIFGALVGNLLGSLFRTAHLIHVTSFPRIKNFSVRIFKQLLRLSLVLFPHKLIALGLTYYSQFVLSSTSSLAALGLYSVAWKFCTPFNTVVGIFQQAWAPYKFEIFKSQKAPEEFFSRFFTIYFSVLAFAYLGTVLLGDDLLELMTQSNFHEASSFLFALGLIPFCSAMYYMLSTGYEFSSTQKLRPLVTLCGFISVVFSSYFLVKPLGPVGIGFSVASGWLTMAVFIFIISYKLFPILYQWNIIAKISLATLTICLLDHYLSPAIYIEICLLFFYVIVILLLIPDLRKVNLKKIILSARS